MKTAVVILNWNTRDYLDRFIPGLVESVAPYDAQVIVADSASTDGSMAMMAERYPEVRRIELDANYGFTGGYNRALAQVEAEYYVLINSDIEVSGDWLGPLQNWMDCHPDCGACGPKLHSWYERDSFEYAGAAGGCIDTFGYPFCRGRVMGRVEKDVGQYDSPARVMWVTGACLMVRSSLWKQLGGLDDRFFAHMEEIDFCWRAQLLGFNVQVVPSSVVYHIGGGTLPSTSPWKLELNYRNNLLMLENNLARTYVAEGCEPAAAMTQARLRIMSRMLLDSASAAVYLVTGRFAYMKAVFKAHSAYRRLRRRQTREDLAAYRESLAGARIQLQGRYDGSIVLASLLKGKNIFKYIREHENRH